MANIKISLGAIIAVADVVNRHLIAGEFGGRQIAKSAANRRYWKQESRTTTANTSTKAPTERANAFHRFPKIQAAKIVSKKTTANGTRSKGIRRSNKSPALPSRITGHTGSTIAISSGCDSPAGLKAETWFLEVHHERAYLGATKSVGQVLKFNHRRLGSILSVLAAG